MKLSIIMPCYNVADTLERALNSILMQKVDFDYEILIVNDCSTDNTFEIANNYAAKHSFIKIFENEINSGNAHTFYVGLCNSKGDYFCVLDGDDYYTIPDKLQRQIDFLDKDEDEEYVATATNFIIDLGDGNISIPARSTYKEFSYVDFLTQASGYYHTATYVYRNIFRGNVPEFFDSALYRGDTPRTTFHLKYSGKKVKVLDFVGSCYVFEFSGIWSSLSQKQQYNHMINYQMKHKLNVDTDFEKKACDRFIGFNKKGLETAKEDLRRYPLVTIDEALDVLVEYTKKFAFKEKNFMLQHFYSSEYIDTLCASIGYINQVRDNASVQVKVSDNIVVITGGLNPGGGGIFEEICELIELYQDKNVYVLVCDELSVPNLAINRIESYKNAKILIPPCEIEEKFQWLARSLAEIAPYRVYLYCAHDNPYGVALIQKSPCEKVVLFSFDHGYICGISSPYIDSIVAKRSVDYWMLKKKYNDKVIYIPTWGKGLKDCEGLNYIPFNKHDKLITACGAARFYKVDGAPPIRYIDIIVEVLKATGGKHYHFGPIPEDVLNEIRKRLDSFDVDSRNFIHVPWIDNMPKFMLENHVDVFIEPFPVVSYKMTLEILAAGIPLIVYKGRNRIHIVDFCPNDTMFWTTKENIINTLLSLNREKLISKSESAQKYFNEFHAQEIITRYIKENLNVCIPEKTYYPDNTVLEMTDNLRLVDNNFKIDICRYIQEKKEALSQEKKERERIEAERVAEQKRIEDEKIIKEKIAKIRNSIAFKVGYVLSYPLRFIKQSILFSARYGVSNGIHEMLEEGVLQYKHPVLQKEYNILRTSTSFRWGNKIAAPLRKIKRCLKEV